MENLNVPVFLGVFLALVAPATVMLLFRLTDKPASTVRPSEWKRRLAGKYPNVLKFVEGDENFFPYTFHVEDGGKIVFNEEKNNVRLYYCNRCQQGFTIETGG